MQKHLKSLSIFAMLAFSLIIVLQMEGFAGKSDKGEIPITTKSEEALAVFLKGQDNLDLGKFLEANALFRKAVEKDPNFAYAYLNIANSATSTAEFKTNMDLAAANAKEISEGEKILIKINLTFLSNDTEKRLELAKKLVKKYPKSQRAWITFAGIHTARNEAEAARASLKKAVELDPTFYLPYTNLGFSYLFSEPKDFVKAKKYMKKVVKLNPEKDTLYINLGDTYRANQELEKAREAYTKATKLDPTNGIAFLKKGHINSFLGNFDEARTDYQQGITVAQDQQKPTYANYKAFTYLHEGDAKSAIHALQKIFDSIENSSIPKHQQNGPRIFTLTNQATIALHHNMFDQAKKCLEQRSKYMREQAEVTGTPEAKRNQEATIILWEGLLAARKGDFKKAAKKAEENAKLLESDNNPRKLEGYHQLMGLLNLKQKKYEKAIEHYQKANLNNMYIRYHLGLAYDGAGNNEEAKKIFKEVATFNFNSVGFALVRKEAIKKI
jgi:tetratricopeptide (TPR) repeat protein